MDKLDNETENLNQQNTKKGDEDYTLLLKIGSFFGLIIFLFPIIIILVGVFEGGDSGIGFMLPILLICLLFGGIIIHATRTSLKKNSSDKNND